MKYLNAAQDLLFDASFVSGEVLLKGAEHKVTLPREWYDALTGARSTKLHAMVDEIGHDAGDAADLHIIERVRSVVDIVHDDAKALASAKQQCENYRQAYGYIFETHSFP